MSRPPTFYLKLLALKLNSDGIAHFDANDEAKDEDQGPTHIPSANDLAQIVGALKMGQKAASFSISSPSKLDGLKRSILGGKEKRVKMKQRIDKCTIILCVVSPLQI